MIRHPTKYTLFPYTTLFRSVTWDDHEVENDYADDRSENLDAPEWFLARRAAAYKAWYEHMPVPRFMLRSEEHTSELQSQSNLVCRLLLEIKKRMTAFLALVI